MDVSAAAAEAEALLGGNIAVEAHDPLRDESASWVLGREEIGSWLVIRNSPQGPEVSVDRDRLLATVDGLSDSLGEGRFLQREAVAEQVEKALGSEGSVAARVYHPSREHVVQPGDSLLEIGWANDIPHWYIEEANPFLKTQGLQVGQRITIPSPDVLLPLPLVPDKRILISIPEQRLRTFYRGEQIGQYVISTGVEDSPTMPGVFQVRTHELNAYASRWDLYMPHFLGIYEASPGFMNGIHGLPMLSSGRRLWAGALGRPASYGCIIMELEAAEELYEWAEDGVVVEIVD
jgi:hypothetical protein